MRAVLVALVLAGCGGSTIGTGTPTPIGSLRPDDQVLLGDFSRVNAVASSFDRVYVAYPTAIGIWRPNERRWDVPRSPPNPRDLEGVRAAVIDPLDQSAWFATDNGWLHYSTGGDRWDRGVLPGRVLQIATNPFDPARGIWFRTTAGWVVQPTIGAATPASPPSTLKLAPTIDDAARDLPQLRALGPTLLVGPRLQPGEFTGAAPAVSGGGWFLGTSNQGLLYFDRTAGAPTPLGLGIPSELVGAVLAIDGGVWVATDADYRTGAAVTHVTSDLGASRSLRGGRSQGMPFDAVRQLVAGERVLWAATDRGLMRLGIDDERVNRFDESRGLPDDRITAIVQHRGRIVAATLRGLSTVDSSDALVRLVPSFQEPATALASRGDTLWVGTNRGLFALVRGSNDLRMPEGLRLLTEGRTTILGVDYVADTLVAMTTDQLLWRDPVSGAWNAGPLLSLQVGRLRVLDASEHGTWVGGDRGAALVYPGAGIARLLTAPGDLPAGVTGIANDGTFLWIGTPAGLVRFRMSQ
ncbi:MAG: hypothetical protein H0W15_10010 [Gemmatimonadales bacterium]|nr:hypothetical protein [Gemmatimonadales bacterium]